MMGKRESGKPASAEHRTTAPDEQDYRPKTLGSA